MIDLLNARGLELVVGNTRDVDSLESKMLGLPQVKYTIVSHFAPGVYVRELRIPRGALVLGHRHRHENLNIMAKGEKIVAIGERVERMVAPYCVLSGPGVRKLGLILEDMVWFSIHANPTNERDDARLEDLLYDKSEAYLVHQELQEAEAWLHSLGPLIPDFK